MKKLTLIVMLLSLVMILSASATVTKTAWSNTSIGTESATVSATVNETVKATIRYGTAANALTSTYTFPANASTFTTTLTGLTGNTKYYYNWNFTQTVTDGAYNSGVSSFTTLDYQVNNSAARTILNLFVFILVALGSIFLIYQAFAKGKNIHEMIGTAALIIVGAIILYYFIIAVLAA